MGSVSKIAQPRSAPTLPPAGVIDRPQVDAEFEALEGLGLEELRLQWRNRWGRLAPAHLSRALLFRLMAYRIQADAFGDLDRQTAKMLDRLAARGPKIENRTQPPSRMRPTRPPLPRPRQGHRNRRWC